ncbi:hypothetical protein [Deinococcus misasensis]|uniref:hypothetical protein n=1 Tax=Deinococcus misasensis TaxID=392413 RepID=UPI00054F1750|nr:hypothetical protein [Deinococcus misasensis]
MTITISFAERKQLLRTCTNAYELAGLSMAMLACDLRPLDKYEELPCMLGRTVRNVIKGAQPVLSVCADVSNLEESKDFFVSVREKNKNRTYQHTESIPQEDRDRLRDLSQKSGVRLSQVYAALIRHGNPLDFLTGLLQDIAAAPSFQRVINATGLFVSQTKLGERLQFPAGVREEQDLQAIEQQTQALEAQRKTQKLLEDAEWREVIGDTLLEGMTVRYRGAQYTLTAHHGDHLTLTGWDQDGEYHEQVQLSALTPGNFMIVLAGTPEPSLPSPEPAPAPETPLDIERVIQEALSADPLTAKFLKGLKRSGGVKAALS